MPKKSRTNRRTCKVYKSCKNVPCGEMMNRCPPSYCSDGSKNWGLCNMGLENPIYKKYCKSEAKCRMSRSNKVSRDQVYVSELNHKLPYIWRHLGRKTRRKMVALARKPIAELNIPYMKP